jgi:hypothetical protein
MSVGIGAAAQELGTSVRTLRYSEARFWCGRQASHLSATTQAVPAVAGKTFPLRP